MILVIGYLLSEIVKPHSSSEFLFSVFVLASSFLASLFLFQDLTLMSVTLLPKFSAPVLYSLNDTSRIVFKGLCLTLTMMSVSTAAAILPIIISKGLDSILCILLFSASM